MASQSFGPFLYILVALILGEIIYKTTSAPSPSIATIPLGETEGEIKGVIPLGTSRVANLTRQHEGDVFIANGLSSCNIDTCVGLSSGTAGLSTIDTREPGIFSKQTNSIDSGICECRCLPYLNTYREDLGICVDDIHECTLSPFISGSSIEKIPFVFLPLRGQIIYPSREISFPDVRTPVCAVTSSHYLTTTGWSDLRNPIDTDFPFRLFRDEGRTFLQWLGEPELRYRMQGRLILVHLMCRDMSLPSPLGNSKESIKNPAKNIFTPCVAFRVSGSPVHYVHNVSEVLFQAEATSNLSSHTEGLSTREYIVIGVCSLLLGLIYVASVFLYLHVKKRKLHSNVEGRNKTIDRDFPKNDQVTFGTAFSRTGSVYSAESAVDPRNSQRSHRSSNISRDDIGIVKNNPLLKHFPNLSDHSGFNSDLSNSNSECEENHPGAMNKSKNLQTSVVIHPPNGYKYELDRNQSIECQSPTQENERLPEANVSIVEDMVNEDKLDNMRAIVNGTVRKKLYFNPAYFEPHLLLSPPPAAIEFLTKIREVIAIAKYKMATKRYQPSLNIIPEEGTLNNSQIYNNTKSSQSNLQVDKHSARTDCSDCPGCLNKCTNCGDKRNSIQKWLESVSVHDGQRNECKNETPSDINTANQNKENNEILNVNENINNELSAVNRKPYEITSTTPKIISHSLKPNICTGPTNVEMAQKALNTLSPSIETRKRVSQNEIHMFAETGNEIYNNPKFNHLDSPPLSQRSRTSSHKNRSSRKRIEVLDQYANPANERNRYEILKSIKHMPDMIYEAMAKDYSIGTFNVAKPNSQPFNIPTPDYDGSIDKKMKDIYNSTQSSDPSVPTPDYSTLGRKTLRQYQPDSPVYRRKSPQYLIVDYETDSLERTTPYAKKTNKQIPSSSSSTSSDANSQPSPSLSSALPLEEEVEIHHTIYDKVEGYRKDGDGNAPKKRNGINRDYEDIKIDSKQNTKNPPRIKYDTPFQGSMTIEVEHEPQSDLELSTDSDQFEPDTLDRKPKKHSFCDVKSNAWTEYLKKSNNFVNSNDSQINYSSLENMNSLPDFSQDNQQFSNNQQQHQQQQLILRSSSSFRSSCKSFSSIPDNKINVENLKQLTTFGSLREIYQLKNSSKQQIDCTKMMNIEYNEPGKLLSLEAKHTKRQRNYTNDNNKKLMPPDVIPADQHNNNNNNNDNFYDIPKYPIKVDENNRKNLSTWNNDNFNGINSAENDAKRSIEDTESLSNSSESTEITGVSDTQINSEFENEAKIKQEENQNIFEKFDNDPSAIVPDCYNNNNNSNNNNNNECHNETNPKFRIYQEIKHEPFAQRSFENPLFQDNQNQSSDSSSPTDSAEDPDKIEILSTRSLSNRSFRLPAELREKLSSETESTNNNNSSIKEDKVKNLQAIYRVEIPSPTSGMKIAIGLKDRAKKSKDLKNAWKKFVSMATSKFNSNLGNASKHFDSPFLKKSKFTDLFDRDEGISSLIDYTSKMIESNNSYGDCNNSFDMSSQNKIDYVDRFNVARSQLPYYDHHHHRYGRNELDSGYLSADSSEVYNRRIYERYNFKSMTEKDHIIKIDTIEDNSDGVENINEVKCSVAQMAGLSIVGRSNNNHDDDDDDDDDDDNNAERDLESKTGIHRSGNNYNSRDFYKPIEVNVHSSSDDDDDDEPYLSACASTESDDECNAEDLCESGAESVETHSVLFRNIRKT